MKVVAFGILYYSEAIYILVPADVAYNTRSKG